MEFVNSQGMAFVKITAGAFRMGGGDPKDNPDALPVHDVEITADYYIAREPVTLEQFKVFRKECLGTEDVSDLDQWMGYLQSVSYNEAESYTKWLSEKEGRRYFLPTEAQWEYAARHSGELSIDRMCDPHIREWCYDFYAPYGEEKEKDPAGPAEGMLRCVRGGFLDRPDRYNQYPTDPWYRCALPPDYRHKKEDTENPFGRHPIGFRVVCGPEPKPCGKTSPFFLSLGVRQQTEEYRCAGPCSEKPYYRKRFLFPVPPDNCTMEEIRAAGFPASFRHHHHSPGFTAAPNGDLIYSVYSTYHEYDAQSGLVGCRFRAGADQWEYPDLFLNPVGVNDHAPMLYTGVDGTIYHFWGWPRLKDAYPFQYVESHDSGETWSEVRFPLFTNHVDNLCSQPVNSCVEASDGTFYLVSDSDFRRETDDTGVQHLGSASVLWRSRDGMRTWENPKGKTAGRHTTAVELKDGKVLALGGKNTDIEGYMPAAVTEDGGDSYQVYRTCFPAMNSGQRPCILRLASGRLVVCGDWQTKKNLKPAALADRAGSYVAWSEDDGETWHFKQLWGTQKRKKTPHEFGGASTVGYSVMRQSPDGLIHVVCSNVQPLLHLTFNEAWLLSEETEDPGDEVLMRSSATKLATERKEYREYYPDGTLKCLYFGGIADDGRFLLDGPETFYYPDGRVCMESGYALGKRVGINTCYHPDGMPWKRFLCSEEDGVPVEVYETFWPGSDRVKTRAVFRNRHASGEAFLYDREGNVEVCHMFTDGKFTEDYSLLEK